MIIGEGSTERIEHRFLSSAVLISCRETPPLTLDFLVQVQWQLKNMQEKSLAQLEGELLAQFQDDTGVEAYIETVKQHSGTVAAEDVTRVIWTVLIQSLNMIGKNQMQLLQMILKSMKANKALLVEFTKTAKQELALLNCVQVTCYEDSKLLKVASFCCFGIPSRLPSSRMGLSSPVCISG